MTWLSLSSPLHGSHYILAVAQPSGFLPSLFPIPQTQLHQHSWSFCLGHPLEVQPPVSTRVFPWLLTTRQPGTLASWPASCLPKVKGL